MTKTAKLFTTGGSQALRLPKEFRFSGDTVTLRRSKNGVVQIIPHDNMEARRVRFMKLAGSCPNLPDVPRHETPDLPRVW